jgi:hypothetical protein
VTGTKTNPLKNLCIPASLWLLIGTLACESRSVHQVTATPAAAYEPSLATFSDGIAVAWYDTRDGHAAIYQRAVNADGTPKGPEQRLTAGDDGAYEADIHALDNGFTVGWYEKAKNGRLTPMLGAWTRDGTRRWVKTLSPSGRNVVVRVSANAIFAAWIQEEENDRAGVWGGWWTADGAETVPTRRLADAGKTTWNLNAAIDPMSSPGSPRAWVVFDAKAGTKSDELFAIEMREGAPRVTRLSADDGFASKYPDLAFSGSRMALTWFDTRDGNEEVYLSVGSKSWLTDGGELRRVRVTTTPGQSIGAYLAWNGDRIGLAWCDDSEGQSEVYFQPFTALGGALTEAQRLTHTPTSSLIPNIRPWQTGFALVWNEYMASVGDAPSGGGSQVSVTLIP